MAFPDLTINEQYDLKAKYNEVTLAMEAATLTLNPQTMARVAAAVSAIPPSPPPANQALISNGGTQLVSSSTGVSYAVQGTYAIAANVVTSFRLPGTSAVLSHANTVSIRNNAGAGQTASATAVITNGTLVGFNLSSDRTVVLANSALTVPVTGTYVSKITPTITNGVVVGFVLS